MVVSAISLARPAPSAMKAWIDAGSAMRRRVSARSAADRAPCMQAVALVEQTLREQLQPTKINLAALGNVVPHLHWHVIARFDWDSHFPAPVWAGAQRARDAAREDELRLRQVTLEAAMRARLGAWTGTRSDD